MLISFFNSYSIALPLLLLLAKHKLGDGEEETCVLLTQKN
jgi:hypothetical protein